MIETERAVLAVLMDRNDLAPVAFDNLDESHFTGNNASIFRAIGELSRDGMDFRWSTVKDAVSGVPERTWALLMDATRGLHRTGYEGFLREKIHALKTECGRRQVAGAISRVASKPMIDIADIEEMGEAISKMRLVDGNHEDPAIAVALDAYDENIRRADSCITTGFPAVDRRVDGFQPGELFTIMMRAAVGKTFVALNMAHHLAGRTPYKMAFFSLEMPKAAIIERLMQIYFGMFRWQVKEEALAGTLDVAEFSRYFSCLSIYDRIYSVSEIKRIVERNDYRVVFVDFLHLIKPEVVGTPYQQVTAIVSGMKKAAKETRAVFVLLHQLSRQAGSGWTAVELAHARDSGAIEELSDFVLGGWAPGKAPNAPDEFHDLLRLALLKNKRGETWVFDAGFSKTGRILESETRFDHEQKDSGAKKSVRRLFDGSQSLPPGDRE